MLLCLASGGIVFLLRRRAVLPRLASLLGILLLLSYATLGCGSKAPAANSNPTKAGMYTYTFSATDGILTHTATYSLTVTAK